MDKSAPMTSQDVSEGLERLILDALHERLPYPTEACAIVRTVFAALFPPLPSLDVRHE